MTTSTLPPNGAIRTPLPHPPTRNGDLRNLPDALAPLIAIPQWVPWKWWLNKQGKWTKPPFRPNEPSRMGDVTDPTTWGDYATAVSLVEQGLADGIGFILTNTEFAALDPDDCRDPDTEEIDPAAQDIINWCQTYTEVSPSGTGLRIIGRGKGFSVNNKFAQIKLEVYRNAERYITITGLQLSDTPSLLADIDPQIDAIVRQYDQPSPPPDSSAKPNGNGHAGDATSTVHRGEEGGGFEELWARCDPELQHDIRRPPLANEDRSSRACSVINRLIYRGFTDADIEVLYHAYPNGAFARYTGVHSGDTQLAGELRRLRPEVERFREKQEAERRKKDEEAERERASKFFSASALHGVPVPKRDWIVPGLIPCDTVTLLSGDGGSGKSLLLKQLCVSTALGRLWLNQLVKPGCALFITAEDEKDELHRRLWDICVSEQVELDALSNFHLRSLAGEDALLATLHDQRSSKLSPTKLFAEIEAYVAAGRPHLVVLDTLADIFPGNENDRGQARHFIGLLRGLALRQHCAVVVPSHPSLSGMNSGTGTSGVTAWGNSVRSRLYLRRVYAGDKGEPLTEPDPDLRILETKKANYGRIGGEIRMWWQNGVFVPEMTLEEEQNKKEKPWLSRPTAQAEQVFLDLFKLFTGQGRRLNSQSGVNYAPAVFAKHPDAKAITNQGFRLAMEELLKTGKIKNVEFGPPSNPRTRLEFA